MLFRLLVVNIVAFAAFCAVLYLLSPTILLACLGGASAYGLWVLVDGLCDWSRRLSEK